MPNKELFRLIRDQIEREPDSHSQREWESHCGTTRCVAGWAIHLTYPDLPVVQTASRKYPRISTWRAVSELARQLLQLRQDEADYMFFDASDDTARYLVEKYAK